MTDKQLKAQMKSLITKLNQSRGRRYVTEKTIGDAIRTQSPRKGWDRMQASLQAAHVVGDYFELDHPSTMKVFGTIYKRAKAKSRM